MNEPVSRPVITVAAIVERDGTYLLVEEETVPAQVVEAVKNCIRIAGPGGGYACSSSNSIHSGVKPENYAAMLQTWREYGRYPLTC